MPTTFLSTASLPRPLPSDTSPTHPFLVTERWEDFTAEDHHTWRILFERQSSLLRNRAASSVINGMEDLAICHTHIPKFSELNAILGERTNFTIVPVKGLIPDDAFFEFLSRRMFPSTCFIRKPHQLDYIEEPDIFHDVFGHVPLLVNPVFADFMQAFGKKGLEAIECGLLKWAAALYWFTVEFGLIHTREGLRIYGAGISSSIGESVHALTSPTVARLPFNVDRILQTPYRVDCFQQTYFVIEDFEVLFETLESLNWQEVKARMDAPQRAVSITLPRSV